MVLVPLPNADIIYDSTAKLFRSIYIYIYIYVKLDIECTSMLSYKSRVILIMVSYRFQWYTLRFPQETAYVCVKDLIVLFHFHIIAR